MQVLIMISLIKEKKVIQTCTAISKCPLNLITGCSTLGIKNCIQVLVNWQRDFHITVEELWHLFFAGLLEYRYIGGLLSINGQFEML